MVPVLATTAQMTKPIDVSFCSELLNREMSNKIICELIVVYAKLKETVNESGRTKISNLPSSTQSSMNANFAFSSYMKT